MIGKSEATFKFRGQTKVAGTSSRTLINSLIGCSSSKFMRRTLECVDEIAKLPPDVSPDIITDLSICYPNQRRAYVYKYIVQNYPDFIVSTLPIYSCALKNQLVDDQELIDIIECQAEAGVSMITIHPTVNRSLIESALKRKVPCTSRGGGIVINDFLFRNSEANVFIRILNDLVRIALKHHLVVSLGATFRSANIFDSFDEAQQGEFFVQKQIADYLNSRGVSVIIEGPGHAAPQSLKLIASEYRDMGYPIMPLGPIPTDTAIGQDHISSAIGATILGLEGCVDIIAAVTREEHTGRVPSVSATLEAIRAARVAGHVVDLYKLNDTSLDQVVVAARVTNSTCIVGKNTSGCERCMHLCPLESIKSSIAIS